MQQQVEFYILDSAEESGRLTCACRIAGKAYTRGMQVYLQTDSAEQTDALDQLLWSFSAASFLPHVVYQPGQPPEKKNTILLGETDPPDGLNQILISLTDKIPAKAHTFDRVADLIGADEQQKAVGRERFRQYRQNGIEPVTHKISVQDVRS